MKATVKVKHSTGDEELVHYELSITDVRVLKTFCEDAWRLRNSSIFGEKAAKRLSLNWSSGNGLRLVGDPIDDEAWAAGMHRLRPLLLKSEPSSFYNVASLLGKRIKHDAMFVRLKYLRQEFRGELVATKITWVDDGIERSMEDIFYLWINAFEHHRDIEKRAYFFRANKLADEHQMRHCINMHAIEKFRAIMGLFTLVIDVCGQRFKPQAFDGLEQTHSDDQTANSSNVGFPNG